MVVDAEGKILRAWAWGGDKTIKNPLVVEQDDGECVEITKAKCDCLSMELHLYKFDHKRRCVVHKDTGEVIEIKTPASAGVKAQK